MHFLVYQPIYSRLKELDAFDFYFMNSLTDKNFYSDFGIPSDQFVSRKLAFFGEWDLYVSADIDIPILE